MPSRDRRAAALVAALVALSLAGCGGDRQGRAAESVPPGFYGIDGDLLLPLAYRGLTGLLDRHLAGIEATGVDFVRAGVNWSATEPRPPLLGHPRYDFEALDAW